MRKSNENNSSMQALAAKYEKEIAGWREICKRQSNEIEGLKKDIQFEERQANDWRRNSHTWKDLYDRAKDRLYAIEHPGASTTPAGDLLKLHNAVTDAMTSEGIAPVKAPKSRTKSTKTATISLICIEADSEGKLDQHSRYTSPGIQKGDLSGQEYFIINELGGEIFQAELFHISGTIVLPKTCTERHLLAYERQQRQLNTKSSNL